MELSDADQTANPAASSGIQVNEPTMPVIDPGEAKLIGEWAKLLEVPSRLIPAYKQLTQDRDYVRRDCMLIDSQDSVAVNHVLRNQIISLAYLGVSDPQASVQPAQRVGHQVAFSVERFAQTVEINIHNRCDQMDFARKIEGACQDASTNGRAILKVTLQSDFMKDPIGGSRFGDQQESVAEYLRLKTAADANVIQPESADAKKLSDLEKTLRLYVAGKLEEQIKSIPQQVMGMVPEIGPTGEPLIDQYTLQPQMVPGLVPDPQDPREVQRQALINGEPMDILGMPFMPHYQGYTCDQVLPEDFRYDWNVTRPEDLSNGELTGNRLYMSPEAIQRKWKDITKSELNAASLYYTGSDASANTSSIDPSVRNVLESPQHNDNIAVWEIYHRPTARRYVFIPGMRRFLENEVFQACGSKFDPYFFLGFNRVTGQVEPISDVQLVRQLQDEINMLRTHDREARKSSYPVLFIPRNVMDDGARELYRRHLPFSIIEINNAEEVAKYFSESTTIPYDPKLYDTSRAESDMQAMFGIPQIVAGGSSGESLASALALAKEGMETGVARRRIQVNRVITDIFKWITEIDLKVTPESYIKETCGQEAVWPRLTTEELYTNLQIDIRGGLQGQPAAKERLELMTNVTNIIKNLGLPVNGVEILKELFDAAGQRTNVQRFLMPVSVAGVGMAPGVQPLTGTPPAGPQPSQGAGPDGGAPTMAGTSRGAPSSLSQVPNHPPMVPNASPK